MARKQVVNEVGIPHDGGNVGFPPIPTDDLDGAVAFGIRLRNAREAAGFRSARSLSLVVGITDTNVRSYERGEQEPKRPLLARLAAACRVSVDWLTTGVPSIYASSAEAIAEGAPPKLLGYAHAKRLGMSAAMAAKAMLQAGTDPDPTVIGELTISIYDLLNADIDPPTAVAQITTMLIDARQEADRRLAEKPPTPGTST